MKWLFENAGNQREQILIIEGDLKVVISKKLAQIADSIYLKQEVKREVVACRVTYNSRRESNAARQRLWKPVASPLSVAYGNIIHQKA